MQQYYTAALMVVVLTIIPSCIEYSAAQQSTGQLYFTNRTEYAS